MRQMTVPQIMDRPDLVSTSCLLEDRQRIDPAHVAFGRHVNGRLVDVTTTQFRNEVRALAKGLIAAGVRPGEAVVIMSPTRYEWAVADFAIWAAGAVVVPIHDTASSTQVAAILSDCDVRVALAGGPSHRDVLEQACPGLHVWSFDADSGRDLSDLVDRGVRGGVIDEDVDRRSALARPDDLASIVFTSGATGGQKGVRITHGNFVRLVVQVGAAYNEVVNDRASTIVLLPLAHVLAQGLQLVSVHAGMKVVHLSDPSGAVAAMAEVRPTFMVVVPHLLEKIRAAAHTKARERGLGRALAAADRTAVSWGRHLERVQDDAGLSAPWGLRMRHMIADRLFFRRMRGVLGGRVEYLLSGASRLDPDLGNFYRGIGVPVLEGYGLTETTAPVTGIRPGRLRAGSVGTPIPGSTVRISDEGEVLVRGVGVSPGYLHTENDQDSHIDGFFRTGDQGTLDEDGFLFIRGRRKNILVTSNGKNIAPEPWEQAVGTDPLIAHAVMVGEDKPYAAALVVLDTDEAIAWAQRKGHAASARCVADARESCAPPGRHIVDDTIVAHLQRTITAANAAVSRAEQVRRFRVLVMDLTGPEHTLLTPTLKLRRAEFLRAVAPHLDALYDEQDQT